MKARTVLLALVVIAVVAVLIQVNGRGLIGPGAKGPAQSPTLSTTPEQFEAGNGDEGVATASGTLGGSTAGSLAANGNAGTVSADRTLAAPGPMSADNEKRVVKFADEMAAKDQRYADLKAMALSDGRDEEWSPRTESALMTSLASNGKGFGGLELGNVRCSRTVCALSATGGTSTESGNADWQRLTGSLMSEPWFGREFNDTATSMINDGSGMVYITYFIRK